MYDFWKKRESKSIEASFYEKTIKVIAKDGKRQTK